MALAPLKYLGPNGSVDRDLFFTDVRRYARDNNVSLIRAYDALAGDRGDLDRRTLGQFALCATANQDLATAAVIIVRSRGIEPFPSARWESDVLGDFFGVSHTDPQMWALSWRIDTLLDWPMGTIMSSSRKGLEGI